MIVCLLVSLVTKLLASLRKVCKKLIDLNFLQETFFILSYLYVQKALENISFGRLDSSL